MKNKYVSVELYHVLEDVEAVKEQLRYSRLIYLIEQLAERWLWITIFENGLKHSEVQMLCHHLKEL